MTISYLYSKLFKKLHGTCIIRSRVDKTSNIGTCCNIVDCTIGLYSYVSHDSQLVATDVGKFCSISDHVYIGGAEHPTSWVSTSPAFEKVGGHTIKKKYAYFKVPEAKRTIIENDVWIGHSVTIKAGVRISSGAVVGAGAVITKDVPPYAIVVGVPAKIIKYRFDEDIIKSLLESEWWSLSDKQLKILSKYIKDPREFIKQLKLMK